MNELEKLEETLLNARIRAEEAKRVYEEAYNAFELQFENEILELREAKSIETLATDALKEYAIKIYDGINKNLSDFVKIRMAKELVYDYEEAFQWAMNHDVALTLDRKAYESLLKSEAMQMPGHIIEVPQCTISRKL